MRSSSAKSCMGKAHCATNMLRIGPQSQEGRPPSQQLPALFFAHCKHAAWAT